MAGGGLRPTFEIAATASPEEIGARVKGALAEVGDRFDARWAEGGRHVVIAPGQRHFWSAWLHLDVRAAAEGSGAVLFGRFAPSRGLWRAYVATLVVIGVVSLFALGLIGSLVIEERDAWGWYAILTTCVGVAAALLFGVLWAQQKAGREMDELRSLIERAAMGKKAMPAEGEGEAG